MTNSAMTSIVLSQLLPEHNLGSAADMAVRGLSLDSRTVRSGEVFVALSGALHDGRDYIQAALARGAAAALVEADARWCEPVFEPVPILDRKCVVYGKSVDVDRGCGYDIRF